MAQYSRGDMVVLTSGSMQMVVESTDGEMISTVWCNQGVIGRDTFHEALLRKWEKREDGGRPGGGFNKGKPFGDRGGDRGGDRDDRPRGGKPGWDGKPREKKFFRKD